MLTCTLKLRTWNIWFLPLSTSSACLRFQPVTCITLNILKVISTEASVPHHRYEVRMGRDVDWLGMRQYELVLFSNVWKKGHGVFPCGAVMCQLRFWIFKHLPPTSAHSPESSSGKKMKITCGFRAFACGVSFSHPKWAAFTWVLLPNWWFPSWMIAMLANCSTCSLEASRMILLNCAPWCTCRWWLLCMIGPGFVFQEIVTWIVPNLFLTLLLTCFCYINCSQISSWQPSLLHELFPNFFTLWAEIEATARNIYSIHRGGATHAYATGRDLN